MDKPLARWKKPDVTPPAWWDLYLTRLRPTLANAVSELQKKGFKPHPQLDPALPFGLGMWSDATGYAIVISSKLVFHISYFPNSLFAEVKKNATAQYSLL